VVIIGIIVACIAGLVKLIPFVGIAILILLMMLLIFLLLGLL
jgi:hypothetical protein